MPSDTDRAAVDSDPRVDPDARAVAQRYHRTERRVSGVVSLFVGGVAAAAALALPLAAAFAVVVLLLVAVRAPVVRSRGRTRLATPASPDAVVDDFAGPTPPTLPLQWGIAEAVVPAEGGVRYEFDYLFGLRSTTMTVEPDVTRPDDPGVDRRVTLTIAAEDRPWGTYRADVRERGSGDEALTGDGAPTGDGTPTRDDTGDEALTGDGAGDDVGSIVDVEWDSDRRFGLRRLPQRFVAERYVVDAVEAQGYEVLERETSLGR